MTLSVCDKSDNDKRVREEAAVDSGAFECVTSKKRLPDVRVEDTPESRRGDTWACAGENEINKRRHGDSQLEDWAWHCEEMSIQSWTSVENIDPCGQTSGNRS